MRENPIFPSARYFGGNLDYSSFDRQLQRDKCRSYDLCVILCTPLHDEFFTYLATSARCMAPFFANGVHSGLCHLCTYRLVPGCLHFAAVVDHSGIPILFDVLQKAARYTSVADYLFDFHSQGLITVCNSTTSSPWMSVGSYFSDCSDVFWHSLSFISKFHP